MATGVYVPIWGLQMTEATVARWLIDEGQPVAKGQGLVVIETYKISGEVPSPADGVLRRRLAGAGDILKVGALLGVVGAAQESEAEIEALISRAPFVTGAPVTKPKLAQAGASPAAPAAPAEAAGADERPPLRATPLARQIAREMGLDLQSIQGSGPRGRIYRRDVEAARASRPAEPVPSRAEDTIVPLTSLRRAIIAKVRQTLEIPYGALSRKVRLDRLLAFRESLAEPFQRRYGLKLSLTHLFFRAAALALNEAPELNSSLDGERIILRGSVNIGMVVTPPAGGGIMIPVVRDVQAKTLDRIARDWASLTDRLESGSLTLEDLSGGTFTISNVGPLGIDVFTPLIHPPESAILGLSRLTEEPVVEDGRIVIGRTVSLIVGADHRVFDAEPIGRFLTALDRFLQNPGELLI